MTPRPLVVATVLIFCSPFARADPDDVVRADALFKSGKELKDAGRLDEACAMFSESRRAANGVGVSLYVADCHERAGRIASAWATFLDAERVARARGDKRAAIAHGRATALEPKVNRVTFVVAPAAERRGVAVSLDGAAVPRQEWTGGVAVDPGSHVVTLRLGDGAPRTVSLAVDARNKATPMRVDDDPPVVALPAQAAPSTLAPPAPASEPEASRGDPSATRKWVGFGLLGTSAASIGVGVALLAAKNESVANAPAGAPVVDHGAEIGSTVAFAVGGAALVSAIVLYLVEPQKDGASAAILAPSLTARGAVLHGTF